jgi:hypothetical protein
MREPELKRGKECTNTLSGYHDLVFDKVLDPRPESQLSQWVCKSCYVVVTKKPLKGEVTQK